MVNQKTKKNSSLVSQDPTNRLPNCKTLGLQLCNSTRSLVYLVECLPSSAWHRTWSYRRCCRNRIQRSNQWMQGSQTVQFPGKLRIAGSILLPGREIQQIGSNDLLIQHQVRSNSKCPDEVRQVLLESVQPKRRKRFPDTVNHRSAKCVLERRQSS
jgi:hypothetical protein